MRVAVLSGKGGAGKTLVAVNLAAAAGNCTYADCDVEEPNGRLFFQPQQVTEQTVSTLLPSFDPEKCTGCRKCVEFCRFNALLYIKKTPMLFPEVCHSCGGCQMVCPEEAIHEIPHPVGRVEIGTHGTVRVITGILNPGEASGVPVIQAVLNAAGAADTIVDCPPGSACSVQESIMDADYCVLVAEPTAFGFHNFQMVYELVTLLHKPCGVVINKEEHPYEPLEQFCREHQIPILMKIPYEPKLAALAAGGKIVSEADETAMRRFRELSERIGGAAQ